MLAQLFSMSSSILSSTIDLAARFFSTPCNKSHGSFWPIPTLFK
jgi:hypothetical protein